MSRRSRCDCRHRRSPRSRGARRPTCRPTACASDTVQAVSNRAALRYSQGVGVAAPAGSVLASRAFVALLPRPAPVPTEAHRGRRQGLRATSATSDESGNLKWIGESMVRNQRGRRALARMLARGMAGLAAVAALAPGLANAALEHGSADAGDADRAADVRPQRLHLLDLRRHLLRRVRRDVLFDLQASQVGRTQGGAVPREHDRGNRLDGHPVPDPARHGVARDQDDPRDEGHHARPTSPSRSPATSGSGATTTCRTDSASTRTSRLRSRRSRTASPRAPTTCWKSTIRWSCRSAPRCG